MYILYFPHMYFVVLTIYKFTDAFAYPILAVQTMQWFLNIHNIFMSLFIAFC